MDVARPGEQDGPQPEGGAGTLHEVRRLLGDAGLPLPPIPVSLVDDMAQLGPWKFGTRTGLPGLYEFPSHLSLAASCGAPDHLLLGHAGHGRNSWAMHYYLALGPLAILLQTAWGGAFMDPEETTADVAWQFDAARELLPVAADALEDGRLRGRRLVVADSSFWGASVGLGVRGDAIAMQRTGHPFSDARALLSDLLPAHR